MKHYILYKTTNLITGQFYFGVHGQVKDDGYLGSGLHIKRQIKKYGKSNFARETIEKFETEREAFLAEVEVLKLFAENSQCINISAGGDGGPNFLGKTHSEETKEKLRELSSGKTMSEESKAKRLATIRSRTEEERQAINLKIAESRSKFSKENPEKQKLINQKISNSLTGRSVESSVKAKISATMKGRVPWNKKLDCGHIVKDKCSC